MLTLDQLKVVVHRKGLTQTDKAPLCLAAAGGADAGIKQIRDLAEGAGVKGAKNMNLSGLLSSSKAKAFKTPAGWELTVEGKEHVVLLASSAIAESPAAKEAQTLRALLPTLKSDETRAFLSEAVVCAEQSLFRAAVVLSWVGAISLLYDHVVATHLSAFNAEATKRDSKWKSAVTSDDLGRMKESVFLEVIGSLGIIGKNVKQELEACLKLRNGCGHPNSLKLGPNKVAAHIETLAMNVYKVFG